MKTGTIIYIDEKQIKKFSYEGMEQKGKRPYVVLEKGLLGKLVIAPITSSLDNDGNKKNIENGIEVNLREEKKEKNDSIIKVDSSKVISKRKIKKYQKKDFVNTTNRNVFKENNIKYKK